MIKLIAYEDGAGVPGGGHDGADCDENAGEDREPDQEQQGPTIMIPGPTVRVERSRSGSAILSRKKGYPSRKTSGGMTVPMPPPYCPFLTVWTSILTWPPAAAAARRGAAARGPFRPPRQWVLPPLLPFSGPAADSVSNQRYRSGRLAPGGNARLASRPREEGFRSFTAVRRTRPRGPEGSGSMAPALCSLPGRWAAVCRLVSDKLCGSAAAREGV